MSCIALPKSAPAHVDPVDTSWERIAEAIRAHAEAQPAELARDLGEWADLMEGVAELRKLSSR